MASHPQTQEWGPFLEAVRSRVQRQTYDTWFRSLHYGGHDDSHLFLNVPTQFVSDWLSENFKDVLRRAAFEAYGKELDVAFKVDPVLEADAPVPEPAPRLPAGAREADPAAPADAGRSHLSRTRTLRGFSPES